MAEQPWTDDGHVLVVTPDGIAPEEGDVRVSIECPASGCAGPYVACDECYGAGTVDDDEGGDEIDCAACGGTGKDGGEHTCWLRAGFDGLRDALSDSHSDPWKLGRFRLLYRTDGFYDDFYFEVRRGDPVAAESREEER